MSQSQEISDKIFQIKNFSCFYGNKQALFNIDLSVRQNKILALIGPSGCGKSTLLRSLNRMNDDVSFFRSTGEILLGGQSILSQNLDVSILRQHVGMVFQKPNPFPKSIEDNIRWGLKIHKMPSTDQVIKNSLEQAFLWEEVKEKLKTSAMSLSGGQQQRLCIARALALRPEVLLLDEPCSALDPIATAKIEELLLTLKKSTTLIIVTHNLAQAMRIADETAFLEQGKLIEWGPTNEIFSSPKVERTAGYIQGRFG
jgi:phosphate transport system ATP-binding protein